MLADLYNDRLIALAANIPCSGVLDNAQHTATRHSRICGSRITVYLDLEDGIVTNFSQEVKACLLGQCAASVVGAHIPGCGRTELLELKDTMQAMLKEEGDPPVGKWQDLALLRPVRDVRARHTSVMLVFEAVAEALGE